MSQTLKKLLTFLAPILGAGAIGVCPLCWIGSASLLTYVGLGTLIPWWRWVGFGLITFGGVGFLLDYRAHKNPSPLILLVLGGVLLYVGRYVFLSTWGAWPIWGLGAALIVAAVIYNTWLFRKQKPALPVPNVSKETLASILIVVAATGGAVFLLADQKEASENKAATIAGSANEKFAYLSENGNSSCSAAFASSISSMPDGSRLQGSCCSLMNPHRYSEQVEGLEQYTSIPEIPPNPYDIEAGLAERLMDYYDAELTPAQQTAYDYAMANSHEEGPCCCKCWRWYTYGGLGKLLIQKYGFTGEQVTEVWNLSDGCGGDEHFHT